MMDGLFNMLGGNATGMQDLLSPAQQQAIRNQSVMAMAAALLKASGPSPQRTTLGQALGGAYEAGQGAMQTGQMSAVQQMLLGQKVREAQLANERTQKFSDLFGGGAAGAPAPAAPLTPEQALLASPDVGGPVGPTTQRAAMIGTAPAPTTAQGGMPAAPATGAAPMSLQQFVGNLPLAERQALAVMEPSEAMKTVNDRFAAARKFGTTQNIVIDGQPRVVQFNDLGEMRVVDGAQPYEANPTEIRTLQALGLPLTFENVQRLKQAGAARQTVNVGDTQFGPTSTDRMRIADPTAPGGFRIIDIPGGQADVEAQQRAQAEAFKQANLERAGGTVVQDIGRALNILQEAGPLATGRGALIGRLDPVSQASQIEDLVGSVRGNIGVDQLQQMRNASVTGGALGNVTERQLEGLQGLLGSLKVTGDRQILEDNLKRISNIYMDTIHGTPEQIRRLGPQLGLTPEQIEMLSERHDLSFDERGRRTGAAGRQRQQSLGEIFGR
jgi:hypothetical protein